MTGRTPWTRLFPRPASRPLPRPRRARPRLERLEDRTLPAVGLLFDAAGVLAIHGDDTAHAVRQALDAAGFVGVAIDGTLHSADPASAAFDPALAGATAASLAGIRFDGGVDGTLDLGGEALAGGLGVVSDAAVRTEDVAVGGLLSIEAPAVTVAGDLRGGAVTLAAPGRVTVEAEGAVAAGRIDVSAGVFVNTGQLHADGPAGGQVVVNAAEVLDAGAVTADGTAPGGAGGGVRITFTDSYIATTAAVTSADGGAGGRGGQVAIDGGATGELFSSGRLEATGSVGGGVDLLGRSVTLVGALADASGDAGGGGIRVGGDYRGGNAAVANAQAVTVTGATALRADARGTGAGGRVVVWSDQETQFDGAVSTRGGPAGGDGGFIEMSSKGGLSYGGTADAGASAGDAGTLLLDPKNIVIDASAGVFPQYGLIDPHPTAGGGFGSGITVLGNGNIVVTNPNDNFGGSKAGAVYLFDGRTGVLISSLVGSSPNDQVGASGITLLSGGNYLVRSVSWNGNRGAVTWGSGSAGVSGVVSANNSLVGASPNDYVGATNTFGSSGITLLGSGNYLVRSPLWNGNRGAVTWGDGTTGVRGVVSQDNSLVGDSPGDYVGALTSFGTSGITVLGSGNYLVQSSLWNGSRGAVTWGSGSAGVSGVVSQANSLVGGSPGDLVGNFGLTVLGNGNYLVRSPNWNGNRGAVTWGDGTTGQTLDGRGTITAQNSLLGRAANAGLGNLILLSPDGQSFLAPFPTDGGGRVVVGLTDPNLFTFARGQGQSVTLTPDFLTRTLDTGTAVVLQASNDITVNDPIIVHAGGHGGALTLQAGRSITLNADITTDNGDLTLIANDTAADGVVDAQRDPGSASIVMAGGTSLDAGTGALTIRLRDGAGLTNRDSRAINLQAVTAGSVSVANDGPDSGSDVRLGPVTTTGPQSYGNPHGVTVVTADLDAGASHVTFTDSVTVGDGVRVGSSSGVVAFSGGGTQTLQSGAGAVFSNLLHDGAGTLRLAGPLAVSGKLAQAAGTLDAADQPVTVGQTAIIVGGTYLAGVGVQSFGGGLVLADGVFASSTGPVTVVGGVSVFGGSFDGGGAVDALTVVRGEVAPGAGVLAVGGAVTFDLLTTFTATLNGGDVGSYSQVAAGGPIDLGGATLNLALGYTPQVGDSFTLLTTGDPGPVRGTFAGLAEGATFSQGGSLFQITYRGGPDGNSVVLTCVG